MTERPTGSNGGGVADEHRHRPTTSGARRMASMAGLLLVALTSGCAAGSAKPLGEPVPDPGATADAIAEGTRPEERRQVTFGWTLNEAGSRVSGRGVLRIQPPERLRLDLFGPRNETVLAAAMVGDSVRLPAGSRTDVAIPSPALLWAGLGAVDPPVAATLRSATTTGEATILRYGMPSEEIYEYTITMASEPRLSRLERIGSRGPLETVELERGDDGEILRASYRDWSAFRDLTLELRGSEATAPFPEEIWTP